MSQRIAVILAVVFALVIVPAFSSEGQESLSDQVAARSSDSIMSDSAEVNAASSSVQTAGNSSDVTSATAESRSRRSPGLGDLLFTGKYYSFLAFIVVGLVLLLSRKVSYWIRVLILLAAFALFGLEFVYPLHPSPVCGITKLFMFKVTRGLFFPAFLAVVIAILVPSLVGRKLFCGWVCPLGALQELINHVPFKYRWKQFSFTAFNSIRMSLLILFVVTLFAVKSQITYLGEQLGLDTTDGLFASLSGYSVYEPINFFELLHWNIDILFIVMFAILILASLAIYRPFCYAVCPIGAITWLLELVAPGRVRVDHEKCIDCQSCVEKSPCPTIAKLRDEKTLVAPDCTSCGECLNTCDEGAISFRFKQ